METILIVSSLLLWVIVICNLFLTLALVRRLNDVKPRVRPTIGLAEGEIAPDFTVPTLSRDTITRSMYAGRKVAFVFISAHCTACHDLLLQIEPLTHHATQAGVTVLLVSSNNQEETRAFIEGKNVPFPVLIAPKETNTFLTDYKSSGTPTFCFVNADGKVHSSGIVSIVGTIWRALDEWINEKVPVH